MRRQNFQDQQKPEIQSAFIRTKSEEIYNQLDNIINFLNKFTKKKIQEVDTIQMWYLNTNTYGINFYQRNPDNKKKLNKLAYFKHKKTGQELGIYKDDGLVLKDVNIDQEQHELYQEVLDLIKQSKRPFKELQEKNDFIQKALELQNK